MRMRLRSFAQYGGRAIVIAEERGGEARVVIPGCGRRSRAEQLSRGDQRFVCRRDIAPEERDDTDGGLHACVLCSTMLRGFRERRLRLVVSPEPLEREREIVEEG